MKRNLAQTFDYFLFRKSLFSYSFLSYIRISAIDKDSNSEKANRCHYIHSKNGRSFSYSTRSTHPSYFNEYFSPTPLLTAGRSAILSIHFSRCGNASISSLVKPVNSHALTQGQVPISATLYLPLPLPARYSRGEPVYLPERWISSTP